MVEAHPIIAVVDDEPAVRKAIERLLRAAKLQVETFGSGAEFLASLTRRVPACVVLDLHMPGLNGFDVQARLANAMPVVVITAHDSTETQDRVLAAGAAAYLRKPVDAPALIGAIRDAIARSTP